MNDTEERMLRELTPDDLAEDYQMLAQAIGMDGLLNLVRHYGGMQIYIPKADNLLRDMKVKEIRQKFNGRNIKQLVNEFGVSESFVYKVIRDKIAQKIKYDIPGQTNIFDMLGGE